MTEPRLQPWRHAWKGMSGWRWLWSGLLLLWLALVALELIQS